MQLCRPKRRCTLARLDAIDLRAQTQIPSVLRSDPLARENYHERFCRRRERGDRPPAHRCLVRRAQTVTGMTRSDAGARALADLGAAVARVSAFDATGLEEALRRSRAEVVIDELTALPKSPSEMAEAAPGRIHALALWMPRNSLADRPHRRGCGRRIKLGFTGRPRGTTPRPLAHLVRGGPFWPGHLPGRRLDVVLAGQAQAQRGAQPARSVHLASADATPPCHFRRTYA
jgi:hypothetical protein